MLEDKMNCLRTLLSSYSSCIVAYSGGVDSVFLAYMAHQLLGKKSLAVISDSPSLPRKELQDALELAEKFGFPVEIVHTKEFEKREYLENPVNRCYFCKQELFTELTPLARARGFSVIAYGENASDVGDHRPGAKAASEFQISAPLKECGLTKAEIRKLSSDLGLPTADKPQMPCLSSRIPFGEPVTTEKLRAIELAEHFLREVGFVEVRVRHHQLSTGGPLARIEVGNSSIQHLLNEGMMRMVDEGLRKCGYQYVTIDLQGYRRAGSILLQAELQLPSSFSSQTGPVH